MGVSVASVLTSSFGLRLEQLCGFWLLYGLGLCFAALPCGAVASGGGGAPGGRFRPMELVSSTGRIRCFAQAS